MQDYGIHKDGNEVNIRHIAASFFLYGFLFVSIIQANTPLRQIGPLFCYGQNILDKGDIRLREWPYYFKNSKDSFTFVSNQLFYALSDDWIVWMDLPTKLNNKGFGATDTLIAARVETEYAYHHIVNSEKRVLVTVLGNCIVPINFNADSNPNPYTNTGSVSFYLATTASLLTQNWYLYGSAGAQANVLYHEKKFGDLFRFEWTVGRSLPTAHWNTYLMVECSGIHFLKSKLHGITDHNSGGTLIYLGPSMISRTDHFYMWIGFQGAALSRLHGNQQQATLRTAVMFAFLF